jgi:hypothetical protein
MKMMRRGRKRKRGIRSSNLMMTIMGLRGMKRVRVRRVMVLETRTWSLMMRMWSTIH